MPRYRPETELAKAKVLTNLYLRNGAKQTRVAKIEGVTKSAVNQRLKRPAVQKVLQEIINQNLKQAGITPRKVYHRLDEQLDANKVISAVIVNRKDKPTSLANGELFDANEKTHDFIDVPDNQARDKAIDKCLTLMGHLKPTNGSGTSNTYVNIWNTIVDKEKGIDDFGRIRK